MPDWEHTLTVDASVDAKRGITGIGIVIQERSGGRGRGAIVARIAEAHAEIPFGSAEEFAVLRALEVAIARGFSRIKIRSDYNKCDGRCGISIGACPGPASAHGSASGIREANLSEDVLQSGLDGGSGRCTRA
jgi:hypothetical protein